MKKKVTVPAKEFLDSQFSKTQQQKIRKEAASLALQHRTLRQLREGRKLTQTQVAEILGIKPENVSRRERTTDMKLSNLKSIVHALGGELELRINFPDTDPIILENG